ncbi:MAG: hypothetical protein IPL53_25535 [Ignavibacteria bacterium]|nr:hypothetical protein [Ignavibacteria bacterium]
MELLVLLHLKKEVIKMKRIYFLIVIFLVLSFLAFSQSVWWNQTSGVSSSLNSVYFIDNNTGFAVGDHYTILKTPNAGNNWLIQQINEAELRGFFSVYFVNNSTGWAVGDGKILKTTNCGINWKGQSSGTGYWFKSVYFIDNNVGWIVGGDGVIINTTNGGTNWTAQSSGTSTWLISVHFEDPDLGWAVGEHGIILCTTNGGINWTGQTSGTEDLISVFFIDANTGWTAGHDYFQTSGKILKTTNGGTNWINQPGVTNKDLNSVYFINDNTGWLVGYHNIFKTTNGGTNWISQTNSPNNNLRSIYVTGLDTAWVVGDSGKILSSTDISLGSLHHDVGVTSIIVPVQDSTYYAGCFSLMQIYPKVEVKRFDTNNPINLFDVHCEITKGINIVYSKTVQDYLSAGETHTISFDYFAWLSDDLDHSEYSLKSWTSLASDSNLTNDTARSIFKIKNPGYGYSEACNYYFINNTTDAFFLYMAKCGI